MPVYGTHVPINRIGTTTYRHCPTLHEVSVEPEDRRRVVAGETVVWPAGVCGKFAPDAQARSRIESPAGNVGRHRNEITFIFNDF